MRISQCISIRTMWPGVSCVHFQPTLYCLVSAQHTMPLTTYPEHICTHSEYVKQRRPLFRQDKGEMLLLLQELLLLLLLYSTCVFPLVEVMSLTSGTYISRLFLPHSHSLSLSLSLSPTSRSMHVEGEGREALFLWKRDELKKPAAAAATRNAYLCIGSASVHSAVATSLLLFYM